MSHKFAQLTMKAIKFIDNILLQQQQQQRFDKPLKLEKPKHSLRQCKQR